MRAGGHIIFAMESRATLALALSKGDLAASCAGCRNACARDGNQVVRPKRPRLQPRGFRRPRRLPIMSSPEAASSGASRKGAGKRASPPDTKATGTGQQAESRAYRRHMKPVLTWGQTQACEDCGCTSCAKPDSNNCVKLVWFWGSTADA